MGVDNLKTGEREARKVLLLQRHADEIDDGALLWVHGFCAPGRFSAQQKRAAVVGFPGECAPERCLRLGKAPLVHQRFAARIFLPRPLRKSGA